jgi:hypothetical protein
MVDVRQCGFELWHVHIHCNGRALNPPARPERATLEKPDAYHVLSDFGRTLQNAKGAVMNEHDDDAESEVVEGEIEGDLFNVDDEEEVPDNAAEETTREEDEEEPDPSEL